MRCGNNTHESCYGIRIHLFVAGVTHIIVYTLVYIYGDMIISQILHKAFSLASSLPAPRSGAVLPDGQLRVPDLEGDFSLNASNVLSADLLMRRGGLTRLAPTYDLDARQMAALARGLGPRASLLEAIVHQHLPIFHTGRQSVTFSSTCNSFYRPLS